jgi:murein DD-endopeptidase MepM/ murein hydrolase activator NlpD
MTAPATRRLNGGLLLAIFGVVAWLLLSVPTEAPPAERPAEPAPPSAETPGGALLIPVAGVRREALVDTFTQSRAQGRRHDAIDIMAPRGTRVVAAAEGEVEKLFFSQGGGGITIYVRSPDRRWSYYYAHLDHYAPGLAEGRHVSRGALIGFVGSTGDASPEAPHLHFAINAMAPGERWWQGTPVNPYPLLAGRRGGAR